MLNKMSASNLLDSIIPISRFNKGEANKIFDEVNKSGCKIVVKNNKPTCVLITPETYQEMVEALEDYELSMIAYKRILNSKDEKSYSLEEVMREFNITEEDLDNAEDVEIE